MKRQEILGAVLTVVLLLSAVTYAQEAGRLKGRLVFAEGRPVAGATVTIEGRPESHVTGSWGTFTFRSLPPGSYTLHFRLAGQSDSETDVRIVSGETTRVEKTVDWPSTTVVIYGASRRGEPIAEAPSAVTSIPEDELELRAATGMVPDLFAGTPGAEVVQIGIGRYELNTRGFNDFLNSRVEVRVDGRELGEPAFGLPTWDRLSFQPDDFERVEFLRGPGSALYGVNAWSGVVALKTKEPRYSLGGSVRLTAGELATRHVGLRWAGSLGNDWYVRVLGGYRESKDFTVARSTTAEYSVLCSPGGPLRDCLPADGAPLLAGPQTSFAGLRFDKYLADDQLLTFEWGGSDQEGLAGAGSGLRFQHIRNEAPWIRAAYSDPRWEASIFYSEPVVQSFGFATQAPGPLSKATDLQARAQARWDLAYGRLRIVAGAEYRRVDPNRGQGFVDAATGIAEPTEEESVFAHADWQVSESIKLVAAARLDESSFHDLEVSPKAALVYRIDDGQTLRFTVNRAFRSSNVFMRHIDTDLAPPQDLQTAFCDPFNVDCGLSLVPVKGYGNNDLVPEEGLGFEIGYSGLLGNKALLTIDLYHMQIDHFLSANPLPQLGTSLGRLNSDFGPWVGPQAADTVIAPADYDLCPVPGFAGETVADCVRAGNPALSNRFDGLPAIVVLSFTNLGSVDTTGADLALQHRFNDRWSGFLNYSWFDSDVEAIVPDLPEIFTPNTPEHRFNLGASYSGAAFRGRIAARRVDDFRWISGFYNGEVRAYTTIDLSLDYAPAEAWTIGVNVSNLLDDRHYEAFGADLLGRRALVYTTVSWD